MPDRPDFTESAAVVGSGSLQLEAGYTFRREGPARVNSAGEVLIRAGLALWAELHVGLNSLVWLDGRGQDSSGFEDVSIGEKVGLLPDSGDRFGQFAGSVAVGFGFVLRRALGWRRASSAPPPRRKRRAPASPR